MKKLLVSFLLIGTFGLYILYQKQQGSEAQVTPPQSQQNSSSPHSNSASPSNSSSTPTGSSDNSNQTSGAYKDGEYTGIVADAFYGQMQVKAIISGGKITDVQFLQYPHDQGTSIEINSQSNPILKQEAIQVQNANVDIVSGATQSSQAFQQSLASALEQAK